MSARLPPRQPGWLRGCKSAPAPCAWQLFCAKLACSSVCWLLAASSGLQLAYSTSSFLGVASLAAYVAELVVWATFKFMLVHRASPHGKVAISTTPAMVVVLAVPAYDQRCKSAAHARCCQLFFGQGATLMPELAFLASSARRVQFLTTFLPQLPLETSRAPVLVELDASSDRGRMRRWGASARPRSNGGAAQ